MFQTLHRFERPTTPYMFLGDQVRGIRSRDQRFKSGHLYKNYPADVGGGLLPNAHRMKTTDSGGATEPALDSKRPALDRTWLAHERTLIAYRYTFPDS
jgi:hypothetical protein